ncbi:MAG: type 2 isopentenyl-diphosphate Delta-isomerase [Candidatus Bathyarchaeota archaeon]|nr:type 2 isopentenyl-diphosphate Delta-isomerase [Candidatus Bathyarchaeota archaeon]
MDKVIKERKADHIAICLKEDVQAQNTTTGFEDVTLVHKALPEIERAKIDLSTTVFGYKFSAPLFVGAMTGGTPEAKKINAAIAEAVEDLHLGMGVGSQRIAVDNPKVADSFSVVREKAPTAFVLANIGGPQLVTKYGVKEAKTAVDMVQANALAIHLNALQEAVQPEGDTNYANLLQNICRLAQDLDVPVIVKETGAGIAAEDVSMLEAAGVAGIDVAGAGGTSWSAVEYFRAMARGDVSSQRLGDTFWDWGIPTAVSVVEAVNSARLPVVASGGIRTGVDAAKCLALGASLASATYPFLDPATAGSEHVKKALLHLVGEVRNAMFLVGANSVQKLQNVPVVVTGKTAEWLRLRGFQPEVYARRKI